jgi:hypothetical protein
MSPYGWWRLGAAIILASAIPACGRTHVSQPAEEADGTVKVEPRCPKFREGHDVNGGALLTPLRRCGFHQS